MPKTILTVLIISAFLITPATIAQWLPQETNTAHHLSSIASVDSVTAIAVGSRGTILMTTNGGVTWAVQSSGTTNWLSGICALNRRKFVAVGWNGTIISTTNASQSWISQNSNTTNSLFSVSFSDSNHGTAVGFGGIILRTTDGGLKWNKPKSPSNTDLRGISMLDKDTGIAVGSSGTIFLTTDAGESWSLQASGTSSNLHDITFVASSVAIALGERGTILRSTNLGVSWHSISSGTLNDLWDAGFSDGTRGLAAGAQGTILRTTNAGISWTSLTSETQADFRGIAVATSEVAYAVGTRGQMFHTSNGGGCLNFPFPQNSKYPFGIMPRNADFMHARESYDSWKSNYVTTRGACGFQRVLFEDMSSTVSEGIAYGMLLAVHFNDKSLFDNLWSYYQKFMNDEGLMSWKISDSCTRIGHGGATDADEDAAFALILAEKQWCSKGRVNYLQDAKTLIERIFTHEVEQRTYILKPGNGNWGGTRLVNPSYFAPAYYRVFAAVTGNKGWLKVADKCYEILARCAHPKTGLVPDWCHSNGKPAPERSNGFVYYWDAARTPWRIALDYLWFGDERALEFCSKITAFASALGAEKISNGYQLDGIPVNPDHNNLFIGTFGSAAMAAGKTFQEFSDASYQQNVLTVPSTEGSYYNWSIRTLTLCLQTGNFVNPLDVSGR